MQLQNLFSSVTTIHRPHAFISNVQLFKAKQHMCALAQYLKFLLFGLASSAFELQHRNNRIRHKNNIVPCTISCMREIDLVRIHCVHIHYSQGLFSSLFICRGYINGKPCGTRCRWLWCSLCCHSRKFRSCMPKPISNFYCLLYIGKVIWKWSDGILEDSPLPWSIFMPKLVVTFFITKSIGAFSNKLRWWGGSIALSFCVILHLRLCPNPRCCLFESRFCGLHST